MALKMMGRKPGAGLISAAFVIMLTLAGCQDPFALEDLIDGPDGRPLTISPTSAVLYGGNFLAIETSGGIPPYSYSVVSGTGTLSGNIYQAPLADSTERVRVGDSAGNSVEAVYTVDATGVTFGIQPALQTVYTGGSIAFSRVGGTGPFEYTLTTNASGGSVNLTSGAYTAGPSAGTDVVTLTDTSGPTADTADVTVLAKPLSVSPQTITVYVNQAVDFAAVGGDGPFSFAVATSIGSIINVSSGAYTAGPNPGTDTITLTDTYDGRSRTATVAVVAAPVVTNVDYAAGAIINITPPAAALTSSVFSADFDIVNNGSAGGAEDITWRIYASADTIIGGADFIVDFGTVAGGTAAGSTTPVSINGTWPLVPGDYYLLADVAAADDLSVGDNRSQSAGSVHVSAPLQLSPAIIDVYTGQDVVYTVSGGTGPFTFAVTTNNSGAPPMAGSTYTAGGSGGSDIVTVTDTYDSATRSSTVNVAVTPLSTSVDYLVGTVTNLGGTLFSGGAVTGDFSLENIGTAVGLFNVNWTVYASANLILGPNDFVIAAGSEAPPPLGPQPPYSFAGFWPTTPGDYYLFVEITALDDHDALNDESVTVGQTTVGGSGPADIEYSIENLTPAAPGAPVLTSSSLSESFDLTNGGTADGTATVYWTAYLSSNTVLEIGTDIPIQDGSISALNAGVSTTGITLSGSWPQSAGTWYLIVTESASDEITAGEYAVSAAVTVNDPAVDYRISNFNVSGTPALTGDTVIANFQVENNSADTGTASIYWTAYVSTDTNIDPGVDPVIDTGVISADLAGWAFSAVQNITGGTWPLSPNSYYLLVKLYSGDDVNNLNDVADNGLHVISLPNIEYEVSGVTAADTTPDAGSAIGETFSLSNIGDDPGSASLNWAAYLSADVLLDIGDLIIDSGSIAGGLAAGASQTGITLNADWPTSPGTWYIIIKEYADDEGTADDWLASAAFSVQPVVLDVDYSILTPPSGGSYEPASAVSESFTLGNLGADAGVSSVNWTVYLSTDIYFDGTDTLFDSGSIAPLGATPASSSIPIDGILWPGAGTYYLIVRSQSTDDQDLTNNSVVSSPYLITSATPGVSDYTVAEITMNYPTDRASSPIRESFTITNIGENAGPVFDWDVYVSSDNVLNIGTDTLVDSATGVAGIGNGASLVVPSIDGAWPDTPDPYYLIVDISAVDGQVANNTVARGPYTIELPPDYSIITTAPRLDIQTEGGNINEAFSSVGVHEFTIEEINGTAGALPVSWSVHFSTDTILDAGDTKVANGAVSAPSPSRTIQIPASTQLPSSSGYWYMIISVSSGEDVNASNNVYVSAPLFVWTQTGDALAMTGNYETDTTEDDIYVGDAEDFAILLNPGDSVQISGLSDKSNPTSFRDSFLIYTGSAGDGVGADVTGLRIRLTWDTNGNDQDLYVFNSGGTGVGSSIEVDSLREPGPTDADWLTISSPDIGPGTFYFIDVVSYAGPDEGDRYFLYVEAF
jgi:hypothetical protein